MKQCTKCGETRDILAFNARRKSRDGLDLWCKPCHAKARKARRVADPLKIAEQSRSRNRNYFAKNAEVIRERARLRAKRLYAADPDSGREKQRMWRAKNIHKVQVIQQRARGKGARRRLAYSKEYALKNREALLAKSKRYRTSSAGALVLRRHESLRRARKKGVTCDSNVSLLDVAAIYGFDCYICGVETSTAAPPRTRFKAELEHVVPLAKGGAHTLENLRCACHPCNAVKGARLTAEDVRAMFE